MKRKMLSMNRRTSRPSSSRKYSAIVRPVRPTRWRAPGGSFIWPNTNAVLAMTPDSVISWMRSLPSRLRSPTPANTDTPACSWATFRISSWMMTVLPTPAPPKMPTLPPFLNGQIRSMILRPVSKTSTSVVCSSNAGGARWIGSVFGVDRALAVDRRCRGRRTRGRGSPRRPGTVIGPPVSTDGDAAGEPVGRGHRDGADPVVAEVLLDLADERVLALALDLDRVVDRRQLAGRELDVDDRAGDLDDPAGRAWSVALAMVVVCLLVRLSRRQRACAPVAISIISRVMLDWRTLL